MDIKDQVRETIRCREDPKYFVNEYIYFYDTQENKIIDLKLWDFQTEYVDSFYKDRFILALKSRQLGFTTVTLALTLHEVIFFKNTRVLIIAQTESDAQNLLANIKFMYEHLPSHLKPQTGRDSVSVLEFPGLNSAIEVKACSPKAGRSIQATHVIMDEFAFYNRGNKGGMDEEIYTAIYPTISRAGRLTIISTPNGMGNKFHALTAQIEAGDLPNWKYFNLKWDVRLDRDDEWYRDTLKALGKKKFAQEYECSFLQSGSPVFDSSYLEVRTRHQDPLPTHRYVIGADTAEGNTDGDFNAAYVIDLDTFEEVAEIRGRYKPDAYAEMLDTLGRIYNNALLGVERNNHGHTVLLRLKQLDYPNIYSGADNKPGFLTSPSSKPIMIDELEEALRTGQLKLASKTLISELKVYQHLGGSKMGAPSGYHDDTVMGLAVAWQMRKRKMSKGYNKRPEGW